MHEAAKTFLDHLSLAIQEDTLELPSLPEVALRVKNAADDPNATVESLSAVVGTDAAITARLIRLANSPLIRGSVSVDNLNSAVMRLGLSQVRNVAVGLAMQQMFQATHDIIDDKMRQTWEHSSEVAAMCQALATQYPHLKPDVAGLGGLIHEMGALPILMLAESETGVLEDVNSFNQIIEQLHPIIGTSILISWEFPAELVSIPMDYLNFQREPKKVDYADIVMVANLNSRKNTGHQMSDIDRSTMPVFNRLGLDPNQDLIENETLQEELEAARQVWCAA